MVAGIGIDLVEFDLTALHHASTQAGPNTSPSNGHMLDYHRADVTDVST